MNEIYWKGIESFILVVSEGSFTSAAEASGKSKAILSQQVSELEKVIGSQLLYRTTRSIRLTDVGREYYSKATLAVKQLEEAQEIAAETTGALRGVVRINMVGGILGEEVISPLLIEFQKLHPELELKLSFSSLHEDLLSSPYDICFRLGQLKDSSLIARNLYTIANRYVASPKLVNKITDIRDPEDLERYPMVYGSVKEWSFKKNNKSQLVKVKRGFQATNGAIMLKATLAGLGIGRMTELRTQQAINEGRLVEVLQGWALPSQLSMVSPPQRYQLKKVRSIVEWMVVNFATQYNEVMNR